ncbi:hypothetical protein ACTHQY_15010 [Rhodococcoides corynebacterioides]|uniref:hypothetical protein n=1 Tax=Rhodococcoides corynebacterioides TaxID=53972 RepID=UPI003F7CDF75
MTAWRRARLFLDRGDGQIDITYTGQVEMTPDNRPRVLDGLVTMRIESLQLGVLEQSVRPDQGEYNTSIPLARVIGIDWLRPDLGARRPDRITTASEQRELASEVVLRTASGCILHRAEDGENVWYEPGMDLPRALWPDDLPADVLYQGET